MKTACSSVACSAARCPNCGSDNRCQLASGGAYKGTCWCQEVTIPQPELRRLGEMLGADACLCADCLRGYALTGLLPRAEDAPPLIQGEDYYIEEGRWVFTAAYHLKRGGCCHSNCRHCPFQ